MTVTKEGSEFRVNSLTNGNQFDPAIAIDADGNFIVTWTSTYTSISGTESRIFAQRYDSDGDEDGDLFVVDGETANAGGSVGGADVGADADGNFVVVWQTEDDDNDSTDGDGDGFAIFAQLYDNDGDEAGSKFQVNSTEDGDQDQAVVSMNANREFVVAWHSLDAGAFGDDSHEIYVQRYDDDGDEVGSEILVDREEDNSGGSLGSPDIVMADDGSFVVVWQSEDDDNEDDDGDGDGFSIFAQRYDEDGDEVGNSFQVNTFSNDDQNRPAISMDGEGNFIVVWESEDQDGDEDGIFARRFDKDGDPIDTKEFQVNTFTKDNQWGADVAMNSNGDFIVSWISEGQDGEDYGIYARKYNKSTGPEDKEFLVNSETDNSQIEPAVALNDAGQGIFAWSSEGQDNSGFGVYGQLFETEGGSGGTDDDDEIKGTDDDDEINGLDGDDILSGGKGDDALDGGEGDDVLKGGGGDDELIGSGGTDRLVGGGDDDEMLGGAGADTLLGKAGEDLLDGGKGNDAISGGKDTDTAIGGKGSDIFTLGAKGLMKIQDFENGQDSLELAGNLQFKQLDISQKGKNTIIEFDDLKIAQLKGIDAEQITAADFG